MILGLQITVVVLSAILVMLILLHRGKGGGLSSLFGGGMQSSLSGSSVVERNLNRITIFITLLWIICIIGVGVAISMDNMVV